MADIKQSLKETAKNTRATQIHLNVVLEYDNENYLTRNKMNATEILKNVFDQHNKEILSMVDYLKIEN